MPKYLMLLLSCLFSVPDVFAETIKLGLNRPSTGPYKIQGLAQEGGAALAVEEINAAGGILGRQVELVTLNSRSKPDKAVRNVRKLAKSGVKMLFGGSSSAVAIAAGKEAKNHDLIYFGTLTYSNATTGKDGHSHMFRESTNAWMSAKVLSSHLNTHYSGKRFFYITANYTWGWSTESSLREFTKTSDTEAHQTVLTPFPNPGIFNLHQALLAAKEAKPDVLVLVQFGKDMATALQKATSMGLKKDMLIVVPSMTLGMAAEAGPTAVEGVIGTVPWNWQVPEKYNFPRGKAFVQKYSARYGTYPSSSSASAYSIVYQYKDAVERAGSFKTNSVIKALEGHSYTLLKDKQHWRSFDHQNIQTIYAVKGKTRSQVLADKFKQDYFEIIDQLSGEQAARSFAEWKTDRMAAGQPMALQ